MKSDFQYKTRKEKMQALWHGKGLLKILAFCALLLYHKTEKNKIAEK